MQTFICFILFHNKLLRKLKKCVAEATHIKRITPIAATQTFDKLLENAEIEHAFLSRNKNTSSHSLSNI